MGVLQLQAALENGYWYARSAEFMGKPIFELLVWMRVPGMIVLLSMVAIARAKDPLALLRMVVN
jgi:nitric oxide reductase large subunit